MATTLLDSKNRKDRLTVNGAPEMCYIWAILGVVYLAFFFYVMAAWMASPDFTRTVPAGPVPDAVKLRLNIMQVVTCTITLITVYYFAVKPKLRTGRFSVLGLFLFAHVTTFIYDPLQNYMAIHVVYNAYPMNMGSWANFLPGYVTPNQHLLPESFFMMIPPYIWYNCLLSVSFAYIWRKLAERFPGYGNLNSLMAIFIVMMITDLVLEFGLLRTGCYSYIGAVRSLSFFPGTQFQFPIYTAFVTGTLMLGCTSLLYYRDDKGESWADRGIHKLRLSDRRKTFLRFLALTGAIHTINVFAFWAPYQWFTVNGDEPPPNMPDYLMNRVCGDGTPYPCNGGEFHPRRTK